MVRIAPSRGRGLSADRLAGHRNLLWVPTVIAAIGGACRDRGAQDDNRPVPVGAAVAVGTSAAAAQILAAVQAQTGSPVQPAVAQSFTTTSSGLSAHFPAAATAATKKPASVVLPAAASAAMSVKDTTSGASIAVTLATALPAPAQTVGGYIIYPAALASGAAVLHRVIPEGTEDFVYFPVRPPIAEVDYTLSLGQGVAALRLIESGLEVLDATGAPRLRVAAPYIVGATGARVDGTLAVSGCAVDSDPSAPWGRSLTSPGASQCTIQVTWSDSTLPYPAILDPRWTTTGSMVTARQGHTATLLSTGKVLVVGGTSNGTTALRSAELYDSISGTWAATASMPTGQQRWRHTATQLMTGSNHTTSGKVLIAGGFDGSFTTSRCELYSVSAGTWGAATSLDRFRQAHVATLLADGKVLVTGGQDDTGLLATASVYDPSFSTGGWSPSDDLPSPIISHQAALLTTSNSQLSNKVLIFGGNNGTATISSVYLYDEVTDTNSTLASMPSTREGHTATVLPNGSVLVTGGKSGSTVLGSTVVFNPSSGSGTWSSAGTMNTVRLAHTATLLSTSIVTNGTVLVAGGNSGSATLSSAELWDGSTTWTATTALPFSVEGQTATSIENGSVLIAGGVNGSTTLSSATLYDGSFGVGCTSNSQCVTGFCVSGVCCDTACAGSCGACNLPGKVGTCSPVSSGTICRGSVGTCDVPETCDGTSTACPSDSVVASGTLCRGSAGTCDAPETCTGSSGSCPADLFAASGTTCRGAVGSCDVAETCSGTSAACPTDAFVAVGTVCRASAGTCDVQETCSGTSGSCPEDSFQPSTTVCRASGGTCDVAENCSGSSADCPPDEFQPLGTVCRPSAGACDATEACTGQAVDCPADGFASSTAVCRPASGPCDAAETCTGSSITCPSDSLAANGTSCTDGNQCVTGKTCQVGVCTGGEATPCSGSGSNTATSVGSSGGSVSLETTSITFSPGAFTDATGVTVTSSTTAAPTGVSAYSPTYKFTPDGAQFSQPVTVTFVVGLGLTRPTIMWSRPGGGWDELGGTYVNGTISATVSHFSEGFVAESPCAGQSEGADCSNGDACSTYTCLGGLCTHVSEVTCPASDSCQTAYCDPAVGCTSSPVANGTLCDQSNPANVCHAGVCGPVTIQNMPIDDLGTLGGLSSAQGVNATGQIIGLSDTNDGVHHGFLWNPPGPIADLGLPAGAEAAAISDSGNIVGSIRQPDQSSHVFYLGPGQQLTDLGYGQNAAYGQPAGDNSPAVDPQFGYTVQGAYGYAVNDSGQIAGTLTSGWQGRGFLYTPGQGFVDIGALWTGWTWANDVASDGTVVGASQVQDTPTSNPYAYFGHAVMYRDGVLIDLNDYVNPTSGMALINATGISDKYIVGLAQGSGPEVPFRFNRATETVEFIPSTWAGGTYTAAVNNVGEVVGIGLVDAGKTQEASYFYSDQLGFRNLNDLLPTDSNWNAAGAAAINDSGDIVGWGWHNGLQRAFRLKMSPETIACQGQATNPGPVCLWVDGVVQDSDHMVAVFGYRNAGASAVQPTVNQEQLNGYFVANPSPAPPQSLTPGGHPGAFLPALAAGDTVGWSVDGQSVSTSAMLARQLVPTQVGATGSAVNVGDTQVIVRPDSTVVPILVGVAVEGMTSKAIFTYTIGAPANVHIPYGSANGLIDDNNQLIASPSEQPPAYFTSAAHQPFVITIPGDHITWTVQGQSVTASANPATPLHVAATTNGTYEALLPDGQSIDLDATAPTASKMLGQALAGKIQPLTSSYKFISNGLPGKPDAEPDGSASYRLPIWTPDGVNGMQPSLAVEYNSEAATGLLGPRWRLSGLSAITRCKKTRAQDGVLTPIDLQGDVFCLDGERLIRLSSTSMEFHPERDNFTKVVGTTDDAGNFTRFTAYQKDGRIFYYGRTPSSRLHGNVTGTAGNCSRGGLRDRGRA